MYIFSIIECDATLCFSYKHSLIILSNMMMARRALGTGNNRTSSPESYCWGTEDSAQEFLSISNRNKVRYIFTGPLCFVNIWQYLYALWRWL